MKIGFNMFLWTGHVTEEHQPTMAALKKQGYDGVQIPVLEGDVSDYSRLKKMLDDMGLECTALTIIPEIEMNPISDDPHCRQKGLDYMKWTLDCTAALGANQLCGPVHQTLGYFSGNGPTEKEVWWNQRMTGHPPVLPVLKKPKKEFPDFATFHLSPGPPPSRRSAVKECLKRCTTALS